MSINDEIDLGNLNSDAANNPKNAKQIPVINKTITGTQKKPALVISAELILAGSYIIDTFSPTVNFELLVDVLDVLVYVFPSMALNVKTGA